MSTNLAVRPPVYTQSLGTDYGNQKVTGRGHKPLVLKELPDGRLSSVRPRNEQEKEIASNFQWMRAILDSPDFWEAAAKLPNSAKPKQRRGGRPATHPDWLFLYIACVTAVIGTQRGAVGEFLDPLYWRWLREATAVNPYRKALGLAKLGEAPLARHHLTYFNKRWRSAAFRPFAEAAKEAALAVARQTALQQGLFDETRSLDYNNPDPGLFVRADGTVFRPPSTSRPSADACTRVDSAAAEFSVGGDKTRRYGSKVTFLSTRTDDYASRLILAYDAVTGDTQNGIGNEAAVTVRLTNELKQALAGLNGIIVDGALRGNHVSDLATQGVLVVNLPYAEFNPDVDGNRRFAPGRIEKSTKVLTHSHKRSSGGTCFHELWVSGSNYFLKVLDARGNEMQVEVHVKNLLPRKNSDGTFRWYHKLELPCTYGGQTVLVPLFHNPRKNSNVLCIENRGEYFRAFPTKTAMFDYVYPRRNDTEALHNQIKRRMRRMPAYGVDGQALFVLGITIAWNAIARAHRLKRAGLPNALDDTN